MSQIYVDVQPKGEGEGEVNVIVASVDRNESRKCIMLSLSPGKKREDQPPIIHLNDMDFVKLADMPRLNRKVLLHTQEDVRKQIEAKSGKVWDAVVAYAQKKNFLFPGNAPVQQQSKEILAEATVWLVVKCKVEFNDSEIKPSDVAQIVGEEADYHVKLEQNGIRVVDTEIVESLDEKPE